jgi:hypothetical protein
VPACAPHVAWDLMSQSSVHADTDACVMTGLLKLLLLEALLIMAHREPPVVVGKHWPRIVEVTPCGSTACKQHTEPAAAWLAFCCAWATHMHMSV